MTNAPVASEDRSEGHFDHDFVRQFDRLLRWRRDVRRFTDTPLDEALLGELIAAAELSPSVGNSQPWRWVDVRSPAPRRAVEESFIRCNAEALAGYGGQRAQHYSTLKLAGLGEAPVHLAVFCDLDSGQGHGLGRRTMPETLTYSVVTAITSFWLAARARRRRRLDLDHRSGGGLHCALGPRHVGTRRVPVRRISRARGRRA